MCFLFNHLSRAVRIAGAVFIGFIFVLAPSAQALPLPWAASDIGGPAVAGSAGENSGTFTIEAAGEDIWGIADQFHFVYQKFTGDVDVIARVASVTNADAWSKAGVMIRGSLSAGSAHAFALVSAGKGMAFQRRTADGGATTHTAGPASAAPQWVRVERTGSTVTASASSDGVTWTTIGSDTIALGSTAYVGLAATSHNTNLLTTAQLSQVSVTAHAVASASAVPAPQIASDIGSPAIKGTVSYSSGVYTVNAAGKDIWSTADQFHFIYQQLTGDVDVKVKVRSISAANGWSKTGVMIRESLSHNSRHAFALVSSSRGYGFHRRIDPGGFTIDSPVVTGIAPAWVRLVRTGSQIEAFRSADGTTWTSMGIDAVPMAGTVYVGIATTSHNTTAATKAVLSGFKATGGGATPPPANQPPTVSLTAPASGATYTAPASVALTATAADTDGTIAKVEFYAGTTLVGTDTTSPYSVTWSSVPAGSYSLTAIAYDNAGAKTTSAARSITVNAAPTTGPPTKVVFQASVDNAMVTSYQLDIFANGANPSTATPVATSNLGKPAVDANGDITVDQATLFSGLAAGTYQATVSAIGSGGSSRSTAVTFTR